MATPSKPITSDTSGAWSAQQVYVLAAVSLLVGLSVGYFFLGKMTGQSRALVQPPVSMTSTGAPPSGMHPKITLEQMKKMADMQASPLIEKSKADPKNAGLLVQIGGIYQGSHQFKEAADYFERALKIDPKNIPTRTQLASCLYYSGDVDGAIGQLNQALKYDPKDANSLFNLGVIRLQGKNDSAGAIAAWEELLKANPNLDRKPIVEKMIADAKSGNNARTGTPQGEKSDGN